MDKKNRLVISNFNFLNTLSLYESELMINTIEEAIEDIKNGKIIIVVDDEDRRAGSF